MFCKNISERMDKYSLYFPDKFCPKIEINCVTLQLTLKSSIFIVIRWLLITKMQKIKVFFSEKMKIFEQQNVEKKEIFKFCHVLR